MSFIDLISVQNLMNFFFNLSITMIICDSPLRPNSFPCAYQPRHRLRKPSATLIYGQNGTDSSLPTAEQMAILKQPQMMPPFQSFSDFLQHGHRGLGPSGSSIVRISAAPQTKSAKPVESKPKNKRADLDSSPKSQQLQPPIIFRADVLHSEYIKLLLESLVRLAAIYRCLSYRGLAPKQRAILGQSLTIKPIQLPGQPLSRHSKLSHSVCPIRSIIIIFTCCYSVYHCLLLTPLHYHKINMVVS